MKKNWNQSSCYLRKQKKLLLIMMLTVFCSVVMTFQAMADGYSQNGKVTMKQQSTTIEQVFGQLEKISSYRFIYYSSDVKDLEKLDVSFDNVDIENAIDECLKGTGLTYEIVDQYVIVKKAEIVEVDETVFLQQDDKTVTLKGQVKGEDGETIPFVSIYVKGNSTIGTVTDANGNFLISSIPIDAELHFSFIGFATEIIDIKNLDRKLHNNLIVVLKSDAASLDEIVITATGEQRKESVIGAISTIKPGELVTPSRSISTSLAGKVSGVTFTQQTGEPGKDGAQFIIRGINSVTGNSKPLILIDGLRRSIDDVDPNDVASFSILKDASATAVYGLEGANGIIIITTKKGSLGAKPKVSVSLSTTVNNSTYKPDWANSVDYANMLNEARAVRGEKMEYSTAEIEKFGDNNNDFYPNVDWWNSMIRKNNLAKKGNFNISGGSSVVSYFISGGFFTEEGMFNGNLEQYDANAGYDGFNFRSNIVADISKSTTIGIGMDGTYNKITEPGQGTQNILDALYTINPTLFPDKYSNGKAPQEPVGVDNPYSLLNRTGFTRNFNNKFSTNLHLTQKLDFVTKNLKAKAVVSFTKENSYSHIFNRGYAQHKPSLNPYDQEGNLQTENSTPGVDEKIGLYNGGSSGNRLVEVQFNLNWARSFNDWNLTAFALYKQDEILSDQPDDGDDTRDVPIQRLINGLPTRNNQTSMRATINYKNKYFFDSSYGLSGSQLFTPKNRYAPFPSVGGGYILSAEPYWDKIRHVVDFFKVRASYGIVGTSDNSDRFQYLATTAVLDGWRFGYGDVGARGAYIPGIGEGRLEQLGLTWGKDYKVDLGVEFTLFKDFRIIADYFKNTRVDQLIGLSNIPATAGLASTPKANLGETTIEGYELDVNYAKDFGNFKINYIKALVSYSEATIVENGQTNPRAPYQSGIGLDYGRYQGYKSLGYFKDQNDIDNSPVQSWSDVKPGDLKYKDVNNDGVITAEDKLWLGNPNPKWNYSLAIDLGYKNWVFATRILGKADMYRYLNQSRTPFALNHFGSLYSPAVNDHYTPASYSGTTATENLNARYPRLAFGDENLNNTQGSSHWLEEASYIRIADIELGYYFKPKKENATFKNIYVYTRMDNVATFSKFKDWNPEQHESSAYPLKRGITLGVEFKFKL